MEKVEQWRLELAQEIFEADFFGIEDLLMIIAKHVPAVEEEYSTERCKAILKYEAKRYPVTPDDNIYMALRVAFELGASWQYQRSHSHASSPPEGQRTCQLCNSSEYELRGNSHYMRFVKDSHGIVCADAENVSMRENLKALVKAAGEALLQGEHNGPYDNDYESGCGVCSLHYTAAENRLQDLNKALEPFKDLKVD